MKENTRNKSLIKINENSMFYKIKKFFRNIFHKKESTDSLVTAEENSIIKSDEDKKILFMKDIKKIEDEETLLLNLQKKYRNGEIREEDMTEEQINSLCALYDKQIANLRKSNNLRKQRLLEYRRKIETGN